MPDDQKSLLARRLGRHGDDGANATVHVQDADVRPTTARLTGRVDLATTGGWSVLVAASVTRKAIGLVVISAVLLLLWRLLVNSAAGAVCSVRFVRNVRDLGWLLVVGSVVTAILGLVASSAGGYEIVRFGARLHLERVSEAGIEPAQLALGGLILLLAEAFRHGPAVDSRA